MQKVEADVAKPRIGSAECGGQAAEQEKTEETESSFSEYPPFSPTVRDLSELALVQPFRAFNTWKSQVLPQRRLRWLNPGPEESMIEPCH